MKQLEVQIMEQGYLLGCPEGGEARLREAVAKVDAAMRRIRDSGKIKARERIAVLAALNLAFDMPREQQPTTAPQHTEDDPRLAALLQRLDNVLGTDGQLL